MSDRTAEDAEAAEERDDDASAADRHEETRGESSAPNRAEPSQGDRPGESTPRDGETGRGRHQGNGTAADESAVTPETDPASEHSRAESVASLAARVAEYDEALADRVRAELEAGAVTDADAEPGLDRERVERELTAREERIDELEAQVSELREKLTRKQADFQNFKKRQQKKVADQQARATEDLLERFLPVRDNLVRALEQDENADIRDGVQGTLNEFDRVLDAESVTPIDPDAGDSPDPNRHEVMMRVESEQPEGTVVDVFRPGYEMDERVVRTAQVTVSDGQGEE
jgi:molecular chaperone GrpE